MLALLPTGRPEALVERAGLPPPEPALDEALVAVEAFSINRGETFLLERPRPGWMPGKDVAGRVVEAAADGSGPEAGARVVGHPPHSGWAQLAAVRTDALTTLPEGVATEQAAALPLAGLTALRLLRAAPSPAGRRMLVTGASGGVGHFVTELAVAAGADVTVQSRSPERLLKLGATAAIEDTRDAVGPFDIVLEAVGGDALAAAFRVIRPGGHLVWFGQASRTPARLDFFDFFSQSGATIRHFHYLDAPNPPRGDLATLVRLVERGALHPEIGLLADWAKTASALADLRDRRLRGNAVLTIKETIR